MRLKIIGYLQLKLVRNLRRRQKNTVSNRCFIDSRSFPIMLKVNARNTHGVNDALRASCYWVNGIRQIHYLCYYQWLQFTPLTEGDTSPLIVGSPHTAVFSIRTVVCGTTRQNAWSTISSDQLVPSYRLITCWHCSPIRELPHYITNVCVVADPGTW